MPNVEHHRQTTNLNVDYFAERMEGCKANNNNNFNRKIKHWKRKTNKKNHLMICNDGNKNAEKISASNVWQCCWKSVEFKNIVCDKLRQRIPCLNLTWQTHKHQILWAVYIHIYINGSIERLNWCKHSKRFMQKNIDIFQCLRMEYTENEECGFHNRNRNALKCYCDEVIKYAQSDFNPLEI